MSSIRVVCRFRPQNKIELAQGGKPIMTISPDCKSVHIKGAESDHTFAFDSVFPPTITQKEVYDDAAKPVIEDVMNGYNGTIFVYGQTSSGKTHTMQGPSIDDPELRGVIPRMINTVFDGVMKADENIEFLVKSSYLEIYMERIRDLLDVKRDNLKVREDKGKGVWVEGATEVYVSKEQDVLDIIRTGQSNRAIAATNMNAESSRSHSLFVMTIGQKNLSDGATKSGKLYLVDLAGSEKVGKTGAQGTTLDEAKMINKSLSALGNVINALTDGKSAHVPYRDSRLTRILQESLGGNSRTTLIINCSPSSYNEAETLSTLRFGSRAKNIKNKAKVNQERSAAELKIALAKAEAEIERLKKYIETLEGVAKAGGTLPARPQTVDGSGASAAKPSGEASAALQAKLVEVEKQLLAQEEEKKSLQEQLDSNNESLQEKEAELVGKNHELTAAKNELNKVMKEIQSLTKENGQMSMQFGELKMAIERARYESTQKELTFEALSTENFTLKTECEELRERVASLEQSQTALEAQIQQQQHQSPAKSAADIAKRHSMEWTQKEQEIQRELQESIKAFESSQILTEEEPPGIHLASGPSWAEEELHSQINDLEEQLQVKDQQLKDAEKHAALAFQQKEEALNAKIEKLQELLQQQHIAASTELVVPTEQPVATLSEQVASSDEPTAAAEEKPTSATEQPTSTEQTAVAASDETTAKEPAVAATEPVASTEEVVTRSRAPSDAKLPTPVAEPTEKAVLRPRALSEAKMPYSMSDSDVSTRSRAGSRARTTSTAEPVAAGDLEHLTSENEKLKTHVQHLEVTIKTAEDAARAKLEAEMKKWQNQTTTRLQEFAAIKEALLLDLENRCQKVIDLEMLLDDAQDKYHGLLNQLKKTGGKTQQYELQEKLDAATAARHQLSIDTNKLKLEVQVATKQLALRDDHIASLEALLKDTQERFHKLARSYEAVADELSRFKTEPQATTYTPHMSLAERIAKPLRGGGGGFLGGSSAPVSLRGGGARPGADNSSVLQQQQAISQSSRELTTLPSFSLTSSTGSPSRPIPRSPSLSSMPSTPNTPHSNSTSTSTTPSTPASTFWDIFKSKKAAPQTPKTPSTPSNPTPNPAHQLHNSSTPISPFPLTLFGTQNQNSPTPVHNNFTPPPSSQQSYAPAVVSATTPASPALTSRAPNPQTPTQR